VVGSTQSTESIPPENRRKESILVEGKDNKKTEFFLQKKGGRRRLNQGLASVAASSHRFEASVRGYTAGTPTFFNIHVREYYSTTQYLDYNIRRRYSDFEKFRKMLVAVHGDSRVPNLPTKIQPIMQKKDTFLAARATGLETFLKRVVNTEIYQGHYLFEFLAKNQAQQSLTLGSQVSANVVSGSSINTVLE